MTIHLSSGLTALRMCKKFSGKTKLIGVSVLTSLDNKNLKEIGYNTNLKKLVAKQAQLARKANLDALVCSAHEIKYVKKIWSRLRV